MHGQLKESLLRRLQMAVLNLFGNSYCRGFGSKMIHVQVSIQHTENTENLQYQSEMMGGNETSDLISVSDGGDEDSENTNEDDNTCDEDNKTDDEYSDDEYSDDEDEHFEDSQEHIKLLNLTLANEEIENDSPIEDLNFDAEEVDIHNSVNNDDIKTIHLENPINFEETEMPIPTDFEQHNLNITSDDIGIDGLSEGNIDLKNILINDLGDGEDLHSFKSEYKKMSLNKLREVVVSKGLVSDASKLKKNDILKMLGDE
jgi:hypothetical protein